GAAVRAARDRCFVCCRNRAKAGRLVAPEGLNGRAAVGSPRMELAVITCGCHQKIVWREYYSPNWFFAGCSGSPGTLQFSIGFFLELFGGLNGVPGGRHGFLAFCRGFARKLKLVFGR